MLRFPSLSLAPEKTEAALDEVHISPRAIERMKRGALLYPDAETGEALVGVMIPPESKAHFPTLYVLETIAPMQNAVRQWAMFSQGDDWQGAIFNWLDENWELYRALRRRSYGKTTSAKWDLPLMHLGDWHKQPGMAVPSNEDYRTAKAFMKENKLSCLLTPIVTLAEEVAVPAEANTLIFEDLKPSVRVDFWGIRRADRAFTPLKPVVSFGYGLPRLPEVVWWLDDRERMDAEIAALERDGLDVKDVIQYNADGMPPLETCFVIYRPGAHQVILAITPHTYPKKAPDWRLAPLIRPQENHDWFEMLFQASTPVKPEAIKGWSGHLHALLDGVHMIERSLEGEQ